MYQLTKPKRLSPGDRVAAISSSAGTAAAVPYRYEVGKGRLQGNFGLHVVEMRHTLKSDSWLRENPQARAEDLMEAFADPSIKGIISTIGGDDSIRMLPYIDLEVIRKNPKILIGYSDTTVSHFMCNKAGLTSFYGPSVLTGFAENKAMFGYTEENFRKVVFSADPIGEIAQADGWTVERLDWFDPQNQDKARILKEPYGRKILQGHGSASGQLIGGCVQVMSMLNGTALWPEADRWKDAIIFMEISESDLTINMYKYLLRSMGAQGIWDSASGIIFARPGGQRTIEQMTQYEDALQHIVGREFARSDIPIVAQMDFGHTDPVFTIPYGAQARIDCNQKRFSILEPGVI